MEIPRGDGDSNAKLLNGRFRFSSFLSFFNGTKLPGVSFFYAFACGVACAITETNMKKILLASCVSLASNTHAFSAEELQLNEVVVTSNRFDENTTTPRSNVRVISKQEIMNSPAISIPDILRMQAGVNVRSLYGNQGIDAGVDMRGFGESATGNVLILLDGQRLNPVDGGSLQWASIPLQSIERIELLSGDGTVLYGDRATGGVINLITNKSGKPAAALTGTLGSYGYKAADGYVAGSSGDLYFNTFIHSADANGWRQNSGFNQWSLSGRAGLCANDQDSFIDYAIYRSENDLPSSISSAMYRDQPRSARTPFDSQTKEGYRIRPGTNIKISDRLEFAAEFAISNMKTHFNNVSFNSTSARDADTYALTPRFKWSHGLANLESVSVLGYDYYRGLVNADYHGGYANGKATQESNAIYWHNDTALTPHLSLSSGVRYQATYQKAAQDAYAPFAMPAVTGKKTNYNDAYDLGLNYHEEHWSIYGKTGSSFRLATTDELFGSDPITFQPLFFGNIIKPQTAKTFEIGTTFKSQDWDGRLAVYRANIHNEIGYDGNLGVNTNFDPTRHQGVEAELGWKPSATLHSKLSYTYTEAKFTRGNYQSETIPLVPRDMLRAQVNWQSPGYGQYVGQINYVGERFVSGDYANTLNKMPSYTTVDLRASWNIQAIQLSLVAQNLTDKKYAPYGIYSTSQNDYYYFPADGRSFYLSMRYDFK